MISYALYKIYNRVMIWSSNIDIHGDVWSMNQSIELSDEELELYVALEQNMIDCNGPMLTDKQRDELMSCVRKAFNKDV